LVEPHAPFADAGGPGVQPVRNGLIAQTIGGPQNDAGALDMAGLRLGLPQPTLQLDAFGFGQVNRSRGACHAPS
jgi:hypothetical protein